MERPGSLDFANHFVTENSRRDSQNAIIMLSWEALLDSLCLTMRVLRTILAYSGSPLSVVLKSFCNFNYQKPTSAREASALILPLT